MARGKIKLNKPTDYCKNKRNNKTEMCTNLLQHEQILCITVNFTHDTFLLLHSPISFQKQIYNFCPHAEELSGV